MRFGASSLLGSPFRQKGLQGSELSGPRPVILRAWRKLTGVGGETVILINSNLASRLCGDMMLPPSHPTTPHPRPSLTFFLTYNFYHQREG